MSPTIEVELRSFVSDADFGALIARFKEEGEDLGVDRQETWYFDCPQDLRIQLNDAYAKVWLKKGKMHDESREEVEIKVGRDEFSRLAALFSALGYEVGIKWFRTRRSFGWKGLTATLDDTQGYGKIIELEKMAVPDEKDAALADLKEKMASLGIAAVPREAFDERFKHYKEHWRELTAARAI